MGLEFTWWVASPPIVQNVSRVIFSFPSTKSLEAEYEPSTLQHAVAHRSSQSKQSGEMRIKMTGEEGEGKMEDLLVFSFFLYSLNFKRKESNGDKSSANGSLQIRIFFRLTVKAYTTSEAHSDVWNIYSESKKKCC